MIAVSTRCPFGNAGLGIERCVLFCGMLWDLYVRSIKENKWSSDSRRRFGREGGSTNPRRSRVTFKRKFDTSLREEHAVN